MRFVENRPAGAEEDSKTDGTLKKRFQIEFHGLLRYALVNILQEAHL
jgi:hypothetical protein